MRAVLGVIIALVVLGGAGVKGIARAQERTSTWEPGIQFWGRHLLSPHTADAAACRDRCLSDARCRAWTFRPEFKICGLLAGIDERLARAEMTSGEIRRSGPVRAAPRPKARTSAVRPNTEFAIGSGGVLVGGARFVPPGTGTPQECMQICIDNRSCVAWQHFGALGTCYLYSQAPSKTLPHRSFSTGVVFMPGAR